MDWYLFCHTAHQWLRQCIQATFTLARTSLLTLPPSCRLEPMYRKVSTSSRFWLLVCIVLGVEANTQFSLCSERTQTESFHFWTCCCWSCLVVAVSMMSSAYSIVQGAFRYMSLEMLSITRMNRSGEGAKLWWTPTEIGKLLDRPARHLTWLFVFLYSIRTQLMSGSCTPWSQSAYLISLWGTRSNAFSKVHGQWFGLFSMSF